MLPELIKVIKSKIATIKNYPGPSVVVNGRGLRDMEVEAYGLAGVVNLPPDGTRVIYLPYGGTRRGACLGGHNYKIQHNLSQGEIKIFSTNAEGDTVKASVTLKADGTIIVSGDSVQLNGNSKAFVTHSELNTALQTFITALNLAFAAKLDGGGTPGTLTLDISASSTTSVKTGG